VRLTRVRVENFRCHRDSTEVEIGNLISLLGRNDAGKSSILEALQIFFSRGAPDPHDKTKSANSSDCTIACEFDEFPDEIVIDAANPTSLADENLLNERGRLEIKKVYDCDRAKPKEKGVYACALHPINDGLADLLTLKNAALKDRAMKLGVNTDDVNLTVNSKIRHALWGSSTDIELELKDVPLTGEDARKVWDQLERAMPLFRLFKSDRPSTDQDEEAQDPMKLAVKEALATKEAELLEITEHVKQEVREIAQRTVDKIREMDPRLASELHPEFSQPKWDSVFKISLTGEEEIPVNKRGSGVRRLILLNFFRAKAEREVDDKNASGVIYAVEEPETCQHPDSQRMLMKAFLELSQRPGCQVMLTTHNPSLGKLLPIDALRFIYFGKDGSRQILDGEDGAMAAVSALGILPDHSVKLFIGIEGAYDIMFLRGIASALCQEDGSLPDLGVLEDTGRIMFIPVGGSNLALWTSRLENLGVSELHIYDRDSDPGNPPASKKYIDEINARDNCSAFSTKGRTIENYLHSDAIVEVRNEVVVTFGPADHVPKVVAQEIHDASQAIERWKELSSEKRGSKANRAKVWLNRDASARMTMARLKESDPDDDIIGWLRHVGSIVGS